MYLLILFCVLPKNVLSKEIPVLQVDYKYERENWKNITNETLYDYPVWVGTGPDLSQLYLNCTASYPVQWIFTGHYFPSSDVEFSTPKRLGNNNSLYNIFISHTFANSHSNWYVSMRIACEKIGNSQIENSILLFVRRNDSSKHLLGASEQAVTDSTVIPCPTTDPTVIPSLFTINNEGVEQEVRDPLVKYIYYEGFRSKNKFSGVYICRSRNSSVTINASIASTVENFEIIPIENIIRAFPEESIHFTCKSKLGKWVNLTLHDADGNFVADYSSTADNATIPLSRQLQGKVKCSLEQGNRTVVVKEWTYKYVRSHLGRSSFEESFSCSTDIRKSSLHVFRCDNKMECSFFSKFSVGGNREDIESKKEIRCIGGSKRNRYCKQTIYLLPVSGSGLGQCIVEGIVKEWEFFTSLENHKYTNWKDAHENELIRMTKHKLPNGITHFFCSAVSYLFADSISFEIEFGNGSRNLLEDNDNTINISDRSHRDRLQVKGFYFVAIMDIILPEDTVAIHCVAPWWNSTENMRTSSYFELARKDSGNVVVYAVTGSVGFLIICVLVVLLLVFIKRHNIAQQLLRSLTDEEVEHFLKGRPELLGNGELSNIETVDMLPFPKEYKIQLTDLQFDSGKNFLGFGNFSYVVRGVIISKGTPVAIKISKPTANVDFFKSLLSEVKIMVYMGKHENVLTLAGVCTENIKNRSIHIATDVCELGDLKNYLIKSRPSFVNIINANQEIDISLITESVPPGQINILDLIRVSCEIAKGMEYLAYKSIIHADLAARNVLLSSNKVVKISDFGLSKKLYENSNYVKKSSTPLPWRWMAVESLTTLTFSTSSDIWAYGVTLFEIFSLGDTPYPNEEWNFGFVSRLKDGMRMGRPNHSTKEIYLLMSECWEREPELRPSFSIIRSFFEKLSGRYFVHSQSYMKAV